MILQHELAHSIDRCPHCRELDEHVGTGPPLLDHSLDCGDMSSSPRELVGDRLRVLVRVVVTCISVHGRIPLGGIVYTERTRDQDAVLFSTDFDLGRVIQLSPNSLADERDSARGKSETAERNRQPSVP
jgi:hypothetical protein